MTLSRIVLAGLLVLSSAACGAQMLSFEPGGTEACASAIHQPVPGKDATAEAAQAFAASCSRHDLAVEKAGFDKLRTSIEAAAPEQRVAFNALMVSFAAFRELRVAHESCTGGSHCAYIQLREEAQLNYDFLRMANGFAGAGFPSYSADDFAREDADLNTAYDTVLASLTGRCPADNADCVPAEAFRNTQRAWIRYRDAWITFGTLRWPKVTAESWGGYLTHQRAREIQDHFGPSVT